MSKKEVERITEGNVKLFSRLSDEEIAEMTREYYKTFGLRLSDTMIKLNMMTTIGENFDSLYNKDPSDDFLTVCNVVVYGSKFFGQTGSAFDFVREAKKPLGSFVRSFNEAMYKIIKGE